MKLLSFVILIFTLSGCAPTNLCISNTIPAEMQQNIITGQSKDIAFEFIPHPQGDLIAVNIQPMWDSSYEINNTFKTIISEVLQSKFGIIDDSAKNKLTIQITDLKSSMTKNKIGTPIIYSLSMTVKALINKPNEENSRDFSYSFAMPMNVYYGVPNANFLFKQDLSKKVEEILLKLAICIDKYIDANRL